MFCPRAFWSFLRSLWNIVETLLCFLMDKKETDDTHIARHVRYAKSSSSVNVKVEQKIFSVKVWYCSEAALSVFPLRSCLSNTSHFTISKTSASWLCFSFSVRELMSHRLEVSPQLHHSPIKTHFIMLLTCFDNLANSVQAKAELSNSNIASASCTSHMGSGSKHTNTGMDTSPESSRPSD